MADRNIAYADLWTIFKESPIYADQIYEWAELKKRLPNMKWQTQAEVLDNAPDAIIKAHAHLLKPEAMKKLGLAVKKEKSNFTSSLWNALS